VVRRTKAQRRDELIASAVGGRGRLVRRCSKSSEATAITPSKVRLTTVEAVDRDCHRYQAEPGDHRSFPMVRKLMMEKKSRYPLGSIGYRQKDENRRRPLERVAKENTNGEVRKQDHRQGDRARQGRDRRQSGHEAPPPI
jgi:hypothetical protein